MYEILWRNGYGSHYIYKQQIKAICFLSGATYRDHCIPLYIKLCIMRLPYVFYKFDAIVNTSNQGLATIKLRSTQQYHEKRSEITILYLKPKLFLLDRRICEFFLKETLTYTEI